MTRFVHIDTHGRQHPPKQPEFEAVLDPETNLMWSIATLSEKMTLEEAKKAVSQLRLCGLPDWRLPTIKESLTLVDYDKCKPAINTDFFPDTKSDWYLTSSPVVSGPGCVWFVSFLGGHSYWSAQDGRGWVRAVRSARQ